MFFFFGPGGGGIIGLLIFALMVKALLRSLKGDDSASTGSDNFGSYYSRTSNPGYIGSDKAFFIGAFSMLAKLAKADGRVNENAKRKINEFMIYDLKLDNQSYGYATSIFNQALEQNVSFESLADSFYQQFSNSPQILQTMIDIFYRIASADGRVSGQEQQMIDYASRVFRIPDSIIDSIRRRYGFAKENRAYAVLGLQENATETEIKKAYRKLILDFHPDTIAAKGLADEFKEYAAKRFREIQEAYETICKERNIK